MKGLLTAAARPSAAVALSFALAVSAAACGSSSTSSSSSGGSSASTSSAAPSSSAPSSGQSVDLKGKRVALVTCEPNVFCHAYNINLTKQLKAAGAQVTQLSDNFDPALQNQHMNQAIAQKPDLIVLFASNADAVVPALRRAKAAGVPVANVNARLKPAGESLINFEVVADNHALGKAAADNLVEGMQKAGYKQGNVILVTGTAGTNIVQDRLDAFGAEMKAHPEYKVVATEDGNWDQVKSSQLASQLLTKYRSQGGVQGAYGMADYQAAGIVQAADQLGIPTGAKPNSLVVTASNCTPTGIPLMQQGKLYGNATQSPIEESDNAYRTVGQFLTGKKVPHTVTVKEQRFTQDNYQSFTKLCADWPK
jgi:ABC-type sugar transport system substrate-binding protein